MSRILFVFQTKNNNMFWIKLFNTFNINVERLQMGPIQIPKRKGRSCLQSTPDYFILVMNLVMTIDEI